MTVHVEHLDATNTLVEAIGPGMELGHLSDETEVQPEGRFTIVLTQDDSAAISGTRDDVRLILTRALRALDAVATTS